MGTRKFRQLVDDWSRLASPGIVDHPPRHNIHIPKHNLCQPHTCCRVYTSYSSRHGDELFVLYPSFRPGSCSLCIYHVHCVCFLGYSAARISQQKCFPSFKTSLGVGHPLSAPTIRVRNPPDRAYPAAVAL